MTYISKTRITVRYAETDMMGIVHHSRYYPWFEQARTDYLKESGFKYSELEKRGFMIPVTETQCKYIRGLTYEDEILVTCRIEKMTVARIEFFYEIFKLPEMEKVSEGRTKHGVVDRGFRPVNAKKVFPDVWEKMASMV